MADYQDEEHIVTILETNFVTHNVKRFKLSKPNNYVFQPGQATDIVINQPKWKNERRSFTFTGLNDWDYLEFTIKIYNDHQGVTQALGTLQAGDELIIHDVWGAIHYRGEGTFIAGGAGITPFIAIFRQLSKEGKIGRNQLIFSNRTTKDIILKEEFDRLLGKQFINTLTDEKTTEYDHQKIDSAYLREKIEDFSQYFYICGPDAMMTGLAKDLEALGADNDKIIIEQF